MKSLATPSAGVGAPCGRYTSETLLYLYCQRWPTEMETQIISR
jgi:hypothetical protein